MINIFNHFCPSGEKRYFTLDGPEYPNKAKMQIPVIVLSGAHDGPTFWINGTVHGDELNGSYAAWEFIRELKPSEIRGNIVVTPVANVAAFVEHTKTSQIDGLDMDTQFPGDSSGMMSQILADLLYKEIQQKASFLINFHTISKLYDAQPYTVSKRIPNSDPVVNQKALDLAMAFGVKTNCVVDLALADGELPGVTQGALDITCILDGIPAFMGEMGHGGIIDPDMVTIAKRGLKNIMIMQNMMKGTPKTDPVQYKITKRKFVRTLTAGMIQMDVAPGDLVNAGEQLARLHYFGNEVTPYTTAEDAYIIATRAYPVINTGDRVAFLGLEWEKVTGEYDWCTHYQCGETIG